MSPASQWGLDHAFASRRRAVLVVGVVGWLAVVPFTTTDAVTSTVVKGLVFVILGVSWNLLAGYAGQISLGHAAFFGLGAFVSVWLTRPVQGLPDWVTLPVVPAFVVALLAAAAVALVTGPIVFRLTGHYFAIGTLALAVLIQIVVEEQEFSGGQGFGLIVNSPLDGTTVYLLALAVAVASLLLTYRIVHSPLGLGMRAVHGDERAASSLGVYPLKYKMSAYVLSGAMAGIAGALWAHANTTILPESTLGIPWMIDILVVVILGGMGTMLGPVLGAGLFLGIDEGLGGLIGGLSTTLEGALIVAFVIFAPRGLYGLLGDHFGVATARAESPGDGATDLGGASNEPD